MAILGVAIPCVCVGDCVCLCISSICVKGCSLGGVVCGYVGCWAVPGRVAGPCLGCVSLGLSLVVGVPVTCCTCIWVGIVTEGYTVCVEFSSGEGLGTGGQLSLCGHLAHKSTLCPGVADPVAPAPPPTAGSHSEPGSAPSSSPRPSPQSPRIPQPTCGGELGHTANVGAVQEAGLAVVDVLHLDDELRLRLQQAVGGTVPSLGSQRIEGFLLTVQPLHGMDVTCQLIDQEDGAGALARDGVLDGPVTLIGVRVDLERQGGRQGGGGGESSPQPPPGNPSRGLFLSMSLL